jgi:hypothetical protein
LLDQEAGKSLLLIKLAKRLICLDLNPEAYIRWQPFIHPLAFVDQGGALLEFQSITSPDIVDK